MNKGKLFAENGNISIPNAKVVNFSQLEAFNGKVSLKYAENSIIVGHEVEIEYAVNCLIIGDIIRVKNSTGCHFFGRRIFVEKIEFPPQARRK